MSEVELFNGKNGRLVYGHAPKNKAEAKTLEQEFDYIYNLKNTPRATWYIEKVYLAEMHLEHQKKRFIHVPTGLDSIKKVFPMALRIAQFVSEGRRVFVHGKSMEDESGAIALTALYILKCKKDFDPVKFVREMGYFDIAAERRIRTLINDCKEKCQNTMLWSSKLGQKFKFK